MTIDRSLVGNRSYWQETTDLNAPSVPLPARAAHVVVGGGIVGSATAYYLAKQGQDVVLIERMRVVTVDSSAPALQKDTAVLCNGWAKKQPNISMS